MDIEKMGAGREMDGLIHHYVFDPTHDPQIHKIRDDEICRHYSTDIAAAWKIVELLTDVEGPYGKQKWSFGLEYSNIIDWVADFTPLRNHPLARKYHAYQGQAGTPPLAICRAALLAVEKGAGE